MTPIHPSDANEEASSSANEKYAPLWSLVGRSRHCCSFFACLVSRALQDKEKEKEKSSKLKQPHQFVSVCHSNSQPCDVCAKSLTNKAALRCESWTLISSGPR